MFILQIAINSFRAANDPSLRTVLGKVLSKKTSICV